MTYFITSSFHEFFFCTSFSFSFLCCTSNTRYNSCRFTVTDHRSLCPTVLIIILHWGYQTHIVIIHSILVSHNSKHHTVCTQLSWLAISLLVTTHSWSGDYTMMHVLTSSECGRGSFGNKRTQRHWIYFVITDASQSISSSHIVKLLERWIRHSTYIGRTCTWAVVQYTWGNKALHIYKQSYGTIGTIK